MSVDLQQAAKDHLWLHFTRMSSYQGNDVPVIVRGSGQYVYDTRGKRYLDGLSGLFVDGGVSPFNNPSLLLFMLATLKGYGFRWPLGADRLRLVSVGTGHRRLAPDLMPTRYAPSATLALLGLRSVMDDCSALAQTMLQWFGTSPSPQQIDAEIGDLADDRIGPEPLLRYQRYDMVFSPEWLQSELSLEFSQKELHAFERMDRPEMVPTLLELGRAAAKKHVVAEHVRQAVETR